MRNFHLLTSALVALALITTTACKSETKYGECVGFDGSDRDPKLTYDISVRNAVWSVLGFEMILPPVLWATDYAYCPDGFALPELEAEPVEPTVIIVEVPAAAVESNNTETETGS